jgi:hypothetical protein
MSDFEDNPPESEADPSTEQERLTPKEYAKFMRRKAYLAAKERQKTDPTFIAMKEKAKEQRKEAYQKQKAYRKTKDAEAKQKAKQHKEDALEQQKESERLAREQELQAKIAFANGKKFGHLSLLSNHQDNDSKN